LRVTGVAGYLSEWQLSGDVAEAGSGSTREFSGGLTMTHIGLCSHEGPDQKPVAIRFELTGPKEPSQIRATLVVDGAKCTFSGALSDSYNGFMSCPDAKNIPLNFSMK